MRQPRGLDEDFSPSARFGDANPYQNSSDFFWLLMHVPYVLLLLLEGGCLALLWAPSPEELQQSRDGPDWWMVLAPAAAVVIFAAARFVFWRSAPVLLRATLSLLPILLLIYIVYLR